MKILFLTENFPPEVNAMATRVFERAQYWAEWGHEVTILTTAPNFPNGELFEGYKNKLVNIEYMDNIKIIRLISYIYPNKGLLLRLLDQSSFMLSALLYSPMLRKYDVIAATSPTYFAGLAGYLLGWLKKRPFVLEISDLVLKQISAVGVMDQNWKIKLLDKIEVHIYKNSNSIIALSNEIAKDVVERSKRKNNIHVIRNGVNTSRYKPQIKNQELIKSLGLENSFIVSYFGTHGPSQSLTNVLHAAKIIQDKSNINFLFAGSGAEKDMLVAKAREWKLSNVHFLPQQPKDKMPDLWSISDVSLSHLKNESLFRSAIPSKIFESMGMGVPQVLVSPDGEARKIVEEEKIGVWVPSGSPEELANKLIELSQNQESLDLFKENSLAAVHRYTREEQARKVLDVIDSTIP